MSVLTKSFRNIGTTLDATQAPADVLSSLCNVIIVSTAVLCVPSVGMVLYRATIAGWNAVYGVFLAVAAVILALSFFRGSLSLRVRSASIVGIFLVIGVGGIFGLGLYSGGWQFLSMTVILATWLISTRAAIVLLSFVGLATTLSAYLHINGIMVFNALPDNTATAEWTIRLMLWLWICIVGSLPIAGLLSHYRSTVLRLDEKTKDLQNSKRQYQDLFLNAVDCLYRADLHGVITAISPSSEDLLGYPSDGLIGKKMSDYYVNNSDRMVLYNLLEENPNGTAHFEAELLNSEGVPQLISSNVRYQRDDEGCIVGVEGSARNITNQRNTEMLISQNQKLDALGKLTSGISHDFNNLLTVITGNAELIADAEDHNYEYAQEISKTARQGAGLVKRLMAFSRPDLLEPSDVLIDQTISQLKGLLSITLGENILLDLDLNASQASVRLDESQLQSSLVNIAINARDAMPNGGTLKIATTSLHADEGENAPSECVRLRLEDDGEGMSKSVLRKALEPFYTTKPNGTGYGLGLAMVNQFVTESGGDLDIESIVGEGSVITITLPKNNSRLNFRDEEKPPVRSSNRQQDLRKCKILVIEDSLQIQRLVSRALRRSGYEIKTASDSNDAIDLLEKDDDFDLILSDIVLPGGLTGVEICQKAVFENPDQKILLMTGYSESIPMNEDGEPHFQVIFKPFDTKDLIATIEGLLSAEHSLGPSEGS